MGLKYELSDGIYCVANDGEFDMEDVEETFSTIRSESGPGNPLHILIVDHGSNFNPSMVDLRKVVEIWASLFQDIPARLALLVAREVHFGLGRMASVFAEHRRLSFAVFREKEDALAWLAAPEDAEPGLS